MRKIISTINKDAHDSWKVLISYGVPYQIIRKIIHDKDLPSLIEDLNESKHRNK